MSDTPPSFDATPPCSLALASEAARRRWTPSQLSALMSSVDRFARRPQLTARTEASREGARMLSRTPGWRSRKEGPLEICGQGGFAATEHFDN